MEKSSWHRGIVIGKTSWSTAAFENMCMLFVSQKHISLHNPRCCYAQKIIINTFLPLHTQVCSHESISLWSHQTNAMENMFGVEWNRINVVHILRTSHHYMAHIALWSHTTCLYTQSVTVITHYTPVYTASLTPEQHTIFLDHVLSLLLWLDFVPLATCRLPFDWLIPPLNFLLLMKRVSSSLDRSLSEIITLEFWILPGDGRGQKLWVH